MKEIHKKKQNVSSGGIKIYILQEPEKYIDLVIKNKENMAALGGNINNEILERYDVVIAMDRQSNLNIAEHVEINQLEQNNFSGSVFFACCGCL